MPPKKTGGQAKPNKAKPSKEKNPTDKKPLEPEKNDPESVDGNTQLRNGAMKGKAKNTVKDALENVDGNNPLKIDTVKGKAKNAVKNTSENAELKNDTGKGKAKNAVKNTSEKAEVKNDTGKGKAKNAVKNTSENAEVKNDTVKNDTGYGKAKNAVKNTSENAVGNNAVTNVTVKNSAGKAKAKNAVKNTSEKVEGIDAVNRKAKQAVKYTSENPEANNTVKGKAKNAVKNMPENAEANSAAKGKEKQAVKNMSENAEANNAAKGKAKNAVSNMSEKAEAKNAAIKKAKNGANNILGKAKAKQFPIDSPNRSFIGNRLRNKTAKTETDENVQPSSEPSKATGTVPKTKSRIPPKTAATDIAPAIEKAIGEGTSKNKSGKKEIGKQLIMNESDDKIPVRSVKRMLAARKKENKTDESNIESSTVPHANEKEPIKEKVDTKLPKGKSVVKSSREVDAEHSDLSPQEDVKKRGRKQINVVTSDTEINAQVEKKPNSKKKTNDSDEDELSGDVTFTVDDIQLSEATRGLDVHVNKQVSVDAAANNENEALEHSDFIAPKVVVQRGRKKLKVAALETKVNVPILEDKKNINNKQMKTDLHDKANNESNEVFENSELNLLTVTKQKGRKMVNAASSASEDNKPIETKKNPNGKKKANGILEDSAAGNIANNLVVAEVQPSRYQQRAIHEKEAAKGETVNEARHYAEKEQDQAKKGGERKYAVSNLEELLDETLGEDNYTPELSFNEVSSSNDALNSTPNTTIMQKLETNGQLFRGPRGEYVINSHDYRLSIVEGGVRKQGGNSPPGPHRGQARQLLSPPGPHRGQARQLLSELTSSEED